MGFTPLESPIIYGGDNKSKSLIPGRKERVKDSSFLTGFTLIEVMIAVAILAVIYSGLMIATNKTFKGWWVLRGSLDVTQKASDALYWISRDFKNAKASSLGNIVSNPGLEDPQEMSSAPIGWENSIVSGGFVQRISSADSPEVRGGVKSIQLSQNTTAYFSDVFTIPETKQYVISGWVKAGGGTAGVRLVQADKTDFAVPISTTCANNYWVHAATSSVITTGQQARFKLDYLGPQWKLDYTSATKNIYGLQVYHNKLYACSNGGPAGYQVYVRDAINDWSVAHNVPAINGTYPYWNVAVCNDKLYISNYTLSSNTHEVSVYDWVTDTWNDSTGLKASYSMSNLTNLYTFKGNLYGCGWKNPTDTQAIKFDGTNTWNLAHDFGNIDLRTMCAFDGGGGEKLYVTGVSGWLYDSDDGITWNAHPQTVGNFFLGVHNNQLYKVMSSGPSQIWNSADGTNWNHILGLDSVMQTTYCLYSYNGKLWLGGNNWIWWMGNWAPSVNVWDGSSVSPSLTLTGENGFITSLCSYNSKLYAGTANGGAGAMGRIYVLGGGENYFDDISISPVEVDTTTIAAIPYEYSSAVTQNSASGNQWRRYRLRYVPKNAPDPAAPGELYREYTLDGANWIAQGLLSSGALCDNVKSFKIINRNQESFTVELTLEKEISTGVKKEYVNYTTITPIVP